MMSLVELGEVPALRDPFLVVHLSGWTDAGMAGQAAVGYLRAHWEARQLAEFDADALIDFRARRPLVRIASGHIEAVSFSPIELLAGSTGGDRDAVLLTGPEPDFRWHSFADAVVTVTERLGVREVYGLGGFPTPALHTTPVSVVGTSADAELTHRLETVPAIVELAGGMQSVLEERLHRAGIPATGLWARVPPYLSAGAHPPAVLALVSTLSRLARVEIPTEELETASREHIEQVEQAIRERPQIGEFIDQIRMLVEQGEGQPIPSGEQIAAELERFLADQPPSEEGGSRP